jgi:hypothetical protein
MMPADFVHFAGRLSKFLEGKGGAWFRQQRRFNRAIEKCHPADY